MLPRDGAEGCKHCERAVNRPFTGRPATKVDRDGIGGGRPVAAAAADADAACLDERRSTSAMRDGQARSAPVQWRIA